MEYRIWEPGTDEPEYFLLVGQAQGAVPYEDYGIKIRRGGVTAQAQHLADSPAKIQRLADRLMERRVGPEGLHRALKALL